MYIKKSIYNTMYMIIKYIKEKKGEIRDYIDIVFLI